MSETIETSGWIPVDDGRTEHLTEPPMVSLYRDGSGRINAAADFQWFFEHDGFKRHVDLDQCLIGFEPVDGDDVRTVSREHDYGGTIALQGALTMLGHDPEELEETYQTELEREGDMVIADISDFVDHTETELTVEAGEQIEVELPGGDDSDGEEQEDSTEIWCGVCGAGPFETNTKLGGHHNGSRHEGATVPLDHEPTEDELLAAGGDEPADHGEADVPDPDEVPTSTTVRDCAESVDTVQELGELLDVTTGKARFLARDADVYGDLRDDVAPMGVSDR